MVFGSVYTGVVLGVDTVKQCYNVQIDQTGAELSNVAYAVPIIASLVGFRMSFILPVGTRVLVAYGQPSFIMGTTASEAVDPANGFTRTVTGCGVNRNATASTSFDSEGILPQNFTGHPVPSDMIEGEFDMSNAVGVALSLFCNMARLSAGDRAKVECCLLNGMVRVLSETFKHHSAFGDFQIYNDGRLNVRWDGTSYDFEAYGQLDPRGEKVPQGNRTADLKSIDAINDTGRWRFTQMVGWLGDLIHMWVTDPVDAMGKIGESALRSGKAHFHVGNDGSILVQSVADISIERVVRIPVPVEKIRYDSPEGVTSPDFEALETRFLKIWNFGPKFKEDSFKTAFMLREYARWYSNFHSLARFHQMQAKKGEWEIKAESEYPVPDYRNEEADVRQANPGESQYIDAYACFRIMRDGSIVTMGAYGENVTFYHGSGHISVPRQLHFESGGDMSFRSGGSIFFNARRSLEFAAAVGSIAMKCRTIFRALCEWGPIHLKSDMGDPSKPGYTAKTLADQPFPSSDPEPVQADNAILLDASQGRIAVYGERTVTIQANGEPDSDTPEDVSASVVVQSRRQGVTVNAQKNIKLQAFTGWVGATARSFAASIMGPILLKCTEFDVNQRLNLRGGALSVGNLKAGIMSAISVIRGPKVPGQADAPGPPPLKVHYNHILPLPDDLSSVEPRYAEDTEVIDEVATDRRPVEVFPVAKIAPSWSFPEAMFYRWTTTPADQFYQTLSQQAIAVGDGAYAGSTEFAAWDSEKEKLQPAPRNATGSDAYPWPGRVGEVNVFTGGEPLSVPSSKPPGEFEQGAMKVVSISTQPFYFLKRS